MTGAGTDDVKPKEEVPEDDDEKKCLKSKWQS
jgi:hypothetical protein